MKKVLLFLILAATLLNAQDIWKKVRVHPSNSEGLLPLKQLAIDPEEIIVDKQGDAIFFVDEKDFAQLQALGLQYEVLIDNWQKYFEALPKLTPGEEAAALEQSKREFGVEGFGFGSMAGYYTFTEAIMQLDSLYARYPNIVSPKMQIATTENGRPVYAVKISDNPNQNEDEPQALFDGLIHAREPISMMTVIYYMYYLCENYGTNPEVTYLVNNREIFFIPVVNPDGYEYNRSTNPGGGGMWRKNRRNSGGSFGVDLNRNYGYMWGYDNSGSSPNPADETYRGPSAFSEPEIAGIRDFVNARNIKTYINFHCYQNAMLYPWGYINAPTPDNDIYLDFCQYMAQYNGYEYGNGGTILGYNTNGGARDWFYGEQTTKQKAFGYTFEIGGESDNFWAPQNRIMPLILGNLRPLLFKTWVAGEYVSLFNPGYQQTYFFPGDLVAIKPVFKNRGLSDATGVTVELQAINPSITVVNGVATLPALPARDTASINGTLSFTISPTAPYTEPLKFLLKTVKNSTVMSVDTMMIPLGMPNYVFLDTAATPATNWDIAVSPVNAPQWGPTTATFATPPVSFTDSPVGNYIANTNSTITTKNAIDLSTITMPRLSFWLRYETETNWDYAQVLISTDNGATFTPLAGKYTKTSSGSFQPSNQPVYNGTQTSWVLEEVPLAPYAGQQVKIRFLLRSDGSVHRDGIYVDDVGIVGYSAIPVELTSFTGAVGENGNPVLRWSVASELNNKGFTIEKRTSEPQGGWRPVGFIKGQGTTLQPKEYSFEDVTGFEGASSVFYRLIQTDFDGKRTVYNPVEVENTLPKEYTLYQNHPNPFNPETVIKYSLPVGGLVVLNLYNALGEKVAELVNGYQQPGDHSVKFNAAGLTSGIYLYELKAGNFSSAKKMILMK
ncbi:MAG: immune inhibitor A [Ignavibacteriales bacterium]|nr:MAG: T9SS type A sorting domain-containing protein [Ignavibacteriaceae bacterium]MBV6444776.1 hypothetical protein [Ignavibacteriaceae bacterium]MBW7873349.1 immune inhibitor A [Ignavibacteria bacterium]MBZ0197839.1 immune inhibitor A [Ignavibacteriaceae bacterium]MCZ2142039.1 immune inhibitor A [Ignavibacteriales bacterium]